MSHLSQMNFLQKENEFKNISKQLIVIIKSEK